MRFRVRLCFTAVLFASLAAGQRLAVYPTTALLDQPVSIVASELRPGERVAVRANLIDGDGHAWRSEAEFIADDQGRVDLATQAPVKGSYRISSSMGLVWSMKPEEKTVNVYRPPHNLGTQTINFELTAAAGSAIAQL
ncbi:MAG: acyl-CoA thioesterase/BAAT N-terminal domain-containing protein, partial [Acidobacteriaceae bacterium]|nr:acyl-CoA thioesterase/BAAT N-terminal domain-containing protein [Acidobacteriaceae bacterium]